MLDEACRQCPASKFKGSKYVDHLLELHALKKGGYPFEKDDLPLDVWRDLGILAAKLDAKRGL